MRTRRTSQLNRERRWTKRNLSLERWITRNLSSEDARPELGMNAVVARVQIRSLGLEAFIHAQKVQNHHFGTKQNKAICRKASGRPVAAVHV